MFMLHWLASMGDPPMKRGEVFLMLMPLMVVAESRTPFQ